MTEIPAISVEGLEKSYREGFWLRKAKVLQSLSFSVPRGQIFGFLGANGAGKTTTIKIALGLQSPDRGGVRLLGHPSSETVAKERIGYLPERPYFQLNFTADEFLDFHRALFKKAGKQTNAELFALVGLEGIGSHYLRSFSKGMLQRIGIAQSLVNDPELLILDEPMSGLDPLGRRDMRNLILELNRAGKTVFFSSHIISDVESLCTQIAFLEKGRLKFFGRVADILGGESQEYEIFFRLPAGVDGSFLGARGNGIQAVGDRSRIAVNGAEEARRMVEACWARGGEVLGFNPVHRSLEAVLFGQEKNK
jgi:ABC-2 type transport system ATP-binding protein